MNLPILDVKFVRNPVLFHIIYKNLLENLVFSLKNINDIFWHHCFFYLSFKPNLKNRY